MSARQPDGTLGYALEQLAEQGKQIGQLRDVVDAVTAKLAELTDLGGDGIGYQPIPAPRWWLLENEERREAISRLADWVETVYRPSYGHLAARLPACWPEHPLCLFLLDWLSELHATLYLQPRRTTAVLAGQAEWHGRLLPVAVDLMSREAAGCAQHRRRA